MNQKCVSGIISFLNECSVLWMHQWPLHYAVPGKHWYLLAIIPKGSVLTKCLHNMYNSDENWRTTVSNVCQISPAIWSESYYTGSFVSPKWTWALFVSFYRLGSSEGREAGVADWQDRKSGWFGEFKDVWLQPVRPTCFLILDNMLYTSLYFDSSRINLSSTNIVTDVTFSFYYVLVGHIQDHKS